MPERSPWWTRIWLHALAVFGAALVIRLVGLDRDAHIDEFFHILAARSWASEGTLRIAEGVYERGALYTMALGEWFRLFGDSLVSARIPSVLAGSLWAAAVYVWTRQAAGSTVAAWLAAGLFALAPGAIWLSQFTRFYAIHGLLFWLGAMAVWSLLSRPLTARSAVPAVGAVLCLGLALNLQITTTIGLAGLGLWVAVELVRRWLAADLPRRTRLTGLVAAAALAFIAAAGLLASGLAAELWHTYRTAVYWNLENRDSAGFYFTFFLQQYPTLWSLLPLAALAAIVGRPRPGLFAAIVFGTVLLLHSFAGNKHQRYIYYAMPYFFVLWGIALVHLFPYLRGLLSEATGHILSALGIDGRGRLRRPVWWALLAVTVGFVMLANPAAFIWPISNLIEPRMPEQRQAWVSAREKLGPLLDSADVILTTDELRSLYYLGRSDILVNKIRLMETPNRVEFSRDPRTGQPTVTTTESVRLVLECFPSGVFISNDFYWRSPNGLTDAAADLLVARAEPIAVPGDYTLHVYRWDTGATPDPEKCAKLPDLGGPDGRRRDGTG